MPQPPAPPDARDHLIRLEHFAPLAQAVRDTEGLLLVVTGAGISLASGIPTFRGTDPGAVWKHDLTEMATFAFFARDPVESWRWYLHRFRGLREVRPNAAHFALVELERQRAAAGRETVVITQNIDTLHEQAGSRRLVKVHGSSDRLRCSSTGCRLGAPAGTLPASETAFEAFLREPCAAALPRCPECHAILRPHVLWFDEYYTEHLDYGWEQVLDAARRAQLALFVGTSFSVGVTDLLVRELAARNAAIYSVDPGATAPPYREVRTLACAAELVLPELVTRTR
jgi:NAD-dependent deacetylase